MLKKLLVIVGWYLLLSSGLTYGLYRNYVNGLERTLLPLADDPVAVHENLLAYIPKSQPHDALRYLPPTGWILNMRLTGLHRNIAWSAAQEVKEPSLNYREKLEAIFDFTH